MFSRKDGCFAHSLVLDLRKLAEADGVSVLASALRGTADLSVRSWFDDDDGGWQRQVQWGDSVTTVCHRDSVIVM